VKLLTYVSIFFLPPAFCVALWSMNEDYSVPPFVITTTTVAAGTYLVVANLDGITRILAQAYSLVRQRVIRLMEQDKRGTWSEKGSQLGRFRPEREGRDISEWNIAYYLLMYAGISVVDFVRRVIRRRESTIER
jgi:hypothetical protein